MFDNVVINCQALSAGLRVYLPFQIIFVSCGIATIKLKKKRYKTPLTVGWGGELNKIKGRRCWWVAGGGELHSSLGVFVTLKNSRVRQTHEQWASENPMAWEHTPCVRPSFGTDDFCVYARVIVLGLTTERNEVTCMLGVIGEGGGERENNEGRKRGDFSVPSLFSHFFSTPPPSPSPTLFPPLFSWQVKQNPWKGVFSHRL